MRLLQRFESVRVEVEAMDEEARVPETWKSPGKEGERESRKSREKVRPMTHLTMYVQGGMWVSMKEAKYDL